MLKASWDGSIVEHDRVTLHANSITAALGIGVFEAVRSYAIDRDGRARAAAFRLRDHYARLVRSLGCLGVPAPLSYDDLLRAMRDLQRANGGHRDCYFKLLVCWDRPLEGTSLVDLAASPMRVAILPRPTPSSFFSDLPALRCSITSWRRSGEVLPVSIKATANYFAARLALNEALAGGYDNAIYLDAAGIVAEATESNVFAVLRDGRIVTPSLTDAVLPGITRDTVLRILRDQGLHPVEERPLSRTDLMSAEEAFLTNTAGLVRGVAVIDGRTLRVGAGSVTEAVRSRLLDVVSGRVAGEAHWHETLD